ncbi:MAG: hypothetical protein HPY85_10310 [Anaerolineae bacterium]|nr:hypothetical protein [Anaerolineae bacterium]
MGIKEPNESLLQVAQNLLDLSLLASIVKDGETNLNNVRSRASLWNKYVDSIKTREGRESLDKGLNLAIELLNTENRSIEYNFLNVAKYGRLLSRGLLHHEKWGRITFRHTDLLYFFAAYKLLSQEIIDLTKIKSVLNNHPIPRNLLTWLTWLICEKRTDLQERFITNVLADKKLDFYVRASVYEGLRDFVRPTINLAEIVIQFMDNEIERKYFFENFENSAWIQPFHNIGFFYDAPPMIELENNSYQSPWWWEGDYLIRFATQYPDVILDLVQNIETNNFRVYSKLMEIIVTLNIEDVVTACDSICGWFHKGPVAFDELLVYPVADLLDKYLQNDRYEEALQLAINVMVPRLVIRKTISEDDIYIREPVNFIDNYWVEKTLQEENRMERIICKVPCASVNVLQKLFKTSYDLTLSAYPVGKEQSLIHKILYDRRVVSDSHRKDYLEIVLDYLVIAMKHCCLSNPDYMQELLRNFLDENPVYQYLTLVTLEDHGNMFPSLLAQVCETPDYVENGLLEMHFWRVWRKQYRNIPENEFAAIVDYIVDKEPEGDDEKYLQRLENERRRYLVPVIDRLEGETQAIAEMLKPDYQPSLDETYGKIPVITEWINPADESPVSQEAWEALSDGDSVALIIELSQKNEGLEGFFEVIRNSVENNPTRYEAIFGAIAGMDINPYILNGFLRGYEEYSRNSKNSVLSEAFSEALLAVVRNDHAQEKRSTFFTVADTVSKQLEIDSIVLGETCVDLLFEILSTIIADSQIDPMTLNDEVDIYSTSAGNSYTISLKSLLQLWVYLHFDHSGVETYLPYINQIKNLLEDQFKLSNFYVNLIFGQFLPPIIQFDDAWFQQIADQLFPKSDSETWQATWAGYVTFRNPVKTSFKTLLPYYQASLGYLESLSEKKAIGDSLSVRTGDHIFLMYIWKWIEIDSDDHLLESFFTHANDETRGSVVFHIGMGIDNIDLTQETGIWERLWKFWQWRFRCIREDGQFNHFSQELRGFSRWMKQIPIGLKDTFSDLELVLRYSNDDFPVRGITSYAAEHCHENIEKAVGLILTAEQYPAVDWRMWKEEDLHTILRAVTNSDNQHAKELANTFINLRGEKKGDFDWKVYLTE